MKIQIFDILCAHVMRFTSSLPKSSNSANESNSFFLDENTYIYILLDGNMWGHFSPVNSLLFRIFITILFFVEEAFYFREGRGNLAMSFTTTKNGLK